MGRKGTQLTLSPAQQAELRQCLAGRGDARVRERALWALAAASGEHTLEELARDAGRVRATIQNWLDKFRTGGVAGLLERRTPPGLASPLAEPLLQAELQAGLNTGRWTTTAAVATWLHAEHGIERSRKGVRRSSRAWPACRQAARQSSALRAHPIARLRAAVRRRCADFLWSALRAGGFPL